MLSYLHTSHVTNILILMIGCTAQDSYTKVMVLDFIWRPYLQKGITKETIIDGLTIKGNNIGDRISS